LCRFDGFVVAAALVHRVCVPSGGINSAAMPSYSRRQLLKLAGACAAPLWLPRSAGGQPRWTETPFQLGVASGSPTHEGVVLWTRLMGPATRRVLESVGQALTVSWELAHDEGFTRIVQRGEAQAVPALAHSVHVELCVYITCQCLSVRQCVWTSVCRAGPV
jgi:hypothetical protein